MTDAGAFGPEQAGIPKGGVGSDFLSYGRTEGSLQLYSGDKL